MKSSNPDWQALDSWLEQLRDRRQIPGIALRVFSLNEVLFEKGYGFRNLEQQLPVNSDTIFGIASISKSFTALAVLHAATSGALRLDDAIDHWLPELSLWRGRTPPTIRQLLTQTSGLPALPTLVHAMAESGRGDPTEAFDPTPPASELRPAGTILEIIEFLNQDARVEEPGGLFCYQNDAWGLLGEIVARASDSEFEDYVDRNILMPLGMDRTTFDLARVLADANATMLYARAPDGSIIASPKWHDSKPLAGAGFLRSTSSDLTRHVRFLLRGDGSPLGIADQLLSEMRSPLVWCGPKSSYGYGLTVSPHPQGVTFIGHGGRLKGVSSHMGFVPELGVGAVVLTNLEEQPADLIWQAAINTVMGLPPGQQRYAPGPGQVPAAEADRILGDYRSGEPWGTLSVRRDPDGTLHVLEGQKNERHAAFLVSKDELAIVGDDQNRYVPVLRKPDNSVYGVHLGRRILYRD